MGYSTVGNIHWLARNYNAVASFDALLLRATQTNLLFHNVLESTWIRESAIPWLLDLEILGELSDVDLLASCEPFVKIYQALVSFRVRCPGLCRTTHTFQEISLEWLRKANVKPLTL